MVSDALCYAVRVNLEQDKHCETESHHHQVEEPRDDGEPEDASLEEGKIERKKRLHCLGACHGGGELLQWHLRPN